MARTFSFRAENLVAPSESACADPGWAEDETLIPTRAGQPTKTLEIPRPMGGIEDVEFASLADPRGE